MLSEKSLPGRQKGKEQKCINCGAATSQEDYCVGCGKYICAKHRVNVVSAFGHSPEDHSQIPFNPMD